jgi:hypothetical protein
VRTCFRRHQPRFRHACYRLAGQKEYFNIANNLISFVVFFLLLFLSIFFVSWKERTHTHKTL